MDTNFYGSVYFTKAFLPHLLENNGQVVFVYPETLSQARRSSYCASKSALSAYGESLAEEMSESNVKVSNVYLPPVTSNLFKETAQTGNLTREEAGKRLLSEIGLIEGSSTSSSEEKVGFFKKLFGR